jgi:hypothetical protein
MATEQQIDEAKVEEFVGKAIGDFSATMTVGLCHIGDRLGLFKDLSDNGPATAAELAQRTGINERYAAEWLRGLAAAGYLDYHEQRGRYELSPEHALVLAVEGSPAFLGGGYQMVAGILEPMDDVVGAFRNGGGASQDVYSEGFWAGLERFSSGWFENFLIQEWIPAMPDAKTKLEAGCAYADVGCGSGRAVIKLAREFDNSRFVGYDIFPTQVERARANLRVAGLDDRVRIELADASEGLPEPYDVISTYDVIHDAADPLALLKGIRRSLKPDGGAGLGTCGLPEGKARALCMEAGFSELRRVPIDNPFNSLYEVRA